MTSELFNELEVADIVSAKNGIKSLIRGFVLEMGPVVAKEQFFVSGGCIASLIQGEMPKDIDIWCRDEDVMAQTIKWYEKIQPHRFMLAEAKYRDVPVGGKMITENAVTLVEGIQLIRRKSGEVKEITDTFDFVHCKPYYDLKDDKLYISKEQYDLCKKKKLKVNNMDAYQSSPWRSQKFIARGYSWA